MNVSILKTVSKSINFLFGVAIISIVSTMYASSSNAENFVVDGNKALNTNNSFVKLDGQPRMAIWDFNPNDNDQQFDRIQGGRGGTLLKHRSTGKCLNVHYLSNGGLVNTWPCNAGDPDQNFNITALGGGYSQIQRTGTNLCLDSPTRDQGGKVHVWQCVNNANQRWKNSSVIVNPPPVTGGPYYRNFEGFIHFAIGQMSIARLDPQTWDSRGQCVTLIARYIQEVYSTGADRTRSIAFGNGKDTANVVASAFSQYFLPATSSGLPNRGAVVSFPQLGGGYGHTAIVMQSRTLSNGQRQMTIMDSNKNGLAPNTQVQEYFYWINIPDGRANGYGNNIYWTNTR
jgi:hypothetical protein